VQVFNKTLRAALDDRLITVNPLERLPVPKIERREMRYLNAEELGVLADHFDPRYRAFVLLGGFGGLRLGEMLALRWNRLDLLRREVTVVETLTELDGALTFGPPKTKASIRTVGLPTHVCNELARLATPGIDGSELVFRSPAGAVVRSSLFRKRFWHPAVSAADLAPLRIHDLRHTAVSLWIAAGANPKQVAVRAGHTSVAVVLDRYGHLYPQQERDLVDALEAMAVRTHPITLGTRM
jgi:integrase